MQELSTSREEEEAITRRRQDIRLKFSPIEALKNTLTRARSTQIENRRTIEYWSHIRVTWYVFYIIGGWTKIKHFHRSNLRTITPDTPLAFFVHSDGGKIEKNQTIRALLHIPSSSLGSQVEWVVRSKPSAKFVVVKGYSWPYFCVNIKSQKKKTFIL